MTFAIMMLIAIAGCATQNPPAKIDTERQAKIEKALRELKDKDASVRSSAALSLGAVGLGVKEYANDIAELLKDKDTDVRSFAVRALGLLEAKEYIKDIAVFLKDTYADVRWDAVRALGHLGAKEYADEIGKLTSDSFEFCTWDETKKNYTGTTVSAEAERVLKEWGVDVEKLKSQNAK